MIDQTLFKQINLNEKQAQIYLNLLDMGPSLVAQIAKSTDLHRAVVYKQLPEMLAMGVVKKMKQGRRMAYAACQPSKLTSLVEQREASFKTLVDELTQSQTVSAPGMTVLEGEDGLKQVMEDVSSTLGRRDTLYRYSSRDPKTDISRFTPKDWSARRQAKGFDQYTITNHALKTSKYKNRMNRISKEIPPDEDDFQYNISLLIYGPKIAIVDFALERAVIFDNQSLADFHRRIFLMLYHRL